MLAGPCLLIFVAVLRVRAKAFDRNGAWSDVMFGAGALAAMVISVSGLVRGLVSQTVRFQDDPLPGPDTLRFVTELHTALYGTGAMLFAAIAMLAASWLALRHGVVARWVGWFGLAAGAITLALVAMLMGAFATPLLLLWVLAVSLRLVLERRRSETGIGA